MRRFFVAIADFLNRFWDIPQILFRFTLAARFFKPAFYKLQHPGFMTQWFTELGYPCPAFCVWTVAISQLACIISFPIGLCTRLVAFVQSIVMGVAIISVHWGNFSNDSDGIEIPLYYFVMLVSLTCLGPGRISIDGLFARHVWRNRSNPAGWR